LNSELEARLYDVYSTTTFGDGTFRLDNIDIDSPSQEIQAESANLITGRITRRSSSAKIELVAFANGGVIEVTASHPEDVVIRSRLVSHQRVRPSHISDRQFVSETLPTGDYEVGVRGGAIKPLSVNVSGGDVKQVTIP
jgi:hypothetical protein